MLLAWAAAHAAFLANHFLGRYVALEIVALCVALLPLVAFQDSAAGIRLSSAIYLLLRLGDAGLLVAILELEAVSGTLFITPALQAGEVLSGARLQIIVVGFVLAVWVKLGGWPFHLWIQAGRRLALASRLWLYATVVPSLGAYLLYRVTPLLAVSGALQTTVLWIGACGALLAALILTQTDQDRMLAYAGALQGGLVLCVAAAGGKYAVWFGLLTLIPVRLLLFLSIDLAKRSRLLTWRKVTVALFVLGGLAWVTLNMLHIWWTGEGAPSPAALFVAEMAVGVTLLWVIRMAWHLWHLGPVLKGSDSAAGVERIRWLAVGGLAGVVLLGGGMFRPLARSLSRAADATLPLPASWRALWLPSLAPLALLVGGILGLILEWQRNRWGRARAAAGEGDRDSAWGVQEGILRTAQVLQTVVEIDILERLLHVVAQTVANGVNVIRFVERECLDKMVYRSARAVVHAVRIVQRWHTGKLRYNLLWLPVVLVLATFLLIMMGGW
jgi:NADH:ubiquinone oxidoreductase subunit 5 (subunit L)/multisubunit Na+/H+ antiporter MnhA subunit